MSNIVFTREKKFSAGKGRYLEVDWFPYTDKQEQAARLPRAKREKVQLPKIKNLNDKYSRRMVRLLIEGNFSENDYHTTLTFSENVTDDRAKKDFRNYIRRLKNAYSKKNIELKYLYVAEHGTQRGRIHYHVILNAGLSRDEIENLWGKHKGFVNTDRLRADESGTFAALEKYIMKSQSQNRARTRVWNCSRNLKRPTLTTNDNSISRRRVTKAFRSRNYDELHQYIESVYSGYKLVSGNVQVNEVTGLLYAWFRLRRLE